MTLDGTCEPWSWDDFPEVLKPRHLMTILDVSDATLYELNHNLLRGVALRIGRQWRYPKVGVRRLLEGEGAET